MPSLTPDNDRSRGGAESKVSRCPMGRGTVNGRPANKGAGKRTPAAEFLGT